MPWKTQDCFSSDEQHPHRSAQVQRGRIVWDISYAIKTQCFREDVYMTTAFSTILHCTARSMEFFFLKCGIF